MNDKKFMELLNLYLDREIDADDALRLEAEVASDPARRSVYDQYCRMQKACSMLTGEAADPERVVVAFPAQRSWGRVPLMGALAAAACFLAVVVVRERPAAGAQDEPGAPAPAARTLASTVDLPASPGAMTSVFLARSPSPAQAGAAGFTALDSPAQDAQLGWIGGVHMAPMFPSPNSELIADPKYGLKAPGTVDPQSGRVVQEPVEMTAFRFQR
jgi:hypothetical protein